MLMSGERVRDLSSERVNAAGIRHVGGGGNRETEMINILADPERLSRLDWSAIES